MIYDLIFIQYVTWPKVIDRVNGISKSPWSFQHPTLLGRTNFKSMTTFANEYIHTNTLFNLRITGMTLQG